MKAKLIDALLSLAALAAFVLLVVTPTPGYGQSICNVTTRGVQCREIVHAPPPPTIMLPVPATPVPLMNPMWCAITVVYNEAEPDAVCITPAVEPACSDEAARKALVNKLTDLLMGERLPR